MLARRSGQTLEQIDDSRHDPLREWRLAFLAAQEDARGIDGTMLWYGSDPLTAPLTSYDRAEGLCERCL